ncbi:MAG: deoxyribodipyrimidine photo-lyase [Gammaproteobacteria bacterium]|nr:deoxyribodipyrimidine photo-lyase [Gammaproteobacteria bacterium]
MAKGLIWFRADLRVSDNPALYAASQDCTDGLIAVYCICSKTWGMHDEAPCKIDFILRNLALLSVKLNKLNIPLLIIELPHFSDCAKALLDLASKHTIDAIYFNKQYEYNERKRDALLIKRFQAHKIAVNAYDEQTILAPGRILNKNYEAFKVFTPFKLKWWAEVSRADIMLSPMPKKQKFLLAQPSQIPHSIPDFTTTLDPNLWPAGEEYVHNRLKQFCEIGLFEYHEQRDFPAIEGTSRLSPYLAQGVISARQCVYAIMDVLDAERPQEILHHRGPNIWVDELIWREFYKLMLIYFPRVSKSQPFKEKAKNLAWHNDTELFKAWCEGKTGFPLVDAAMRQLNSTGWMHNRLRMVTAMFLSKTLLINWQWGERYFMQHLIDGDLAANNGGWQWSASTGTDAVPYFRIFNPTTQSQKFDPDGEFIKQFCPELEDCTKKTIHQPRNPIVDYKVSRQLALAMYKAL